MDRNLLKGIINYAKENNMYHNTYFSNVIAHIGLDAMICGAPREEIIAAFAEDISSDKENSRVNEILIGYKLRGNDSYPNWGMLC